MALAEAGAAAARSRLAEDPASIRSIDALRRELLPPLARIGALPAHLARADAAAERPLPGSASWASVQYALLQHVLVTWGEALREQGLWDTICIGWFCPEVATPEAAQVWRSALDVCSTLLSSASRAQDGGTLHPIVRDALHNILLNMCTGDALTRALAALDADPNSARRQLTWETCVAQLVALPTRVANVLHEDTQLVCEYDAFLAHVVCAADAQLAAAASRVSAANASRPEQLALLFAKLARVGFLEVPPDASAAPTSSFWGALLPRVLGRAGGEGFPAAYVEAWNRLAAALPDTAHETLLHTLVRHVDRQGLERTGAAWPVAPAERSPGTEGTAFLSDRAEAASAAAFALLTLLDGEARDAGAARLDLVPAQLASACTPRMAIALGRWLVRTPQDADEVLPRLVAFWSDVQRCRRATVRQEQALTALLFYSMGAVDADAQRAVLSPIASTPSFLGGVSVHMDHADPVVRRLGMLVAEIVSARTVAPGSHALHFPSAVWDGRGDGREVCRVLRALALRPGHVEVEAAMHPAQWRQLLSVDEPAPSAAVAAARAAGSAPTAKREVPRTRRLPQRVAPQRAQKDTARPKPLIEPLEPGAAPAPRPLIEPLGDDGQPEPAPGFKTYSGTLQSDDEGESSVDDSDSDEGDAQRDDVERIVQELGGESGGEALKQARDAHRGEMQAGDDLDRAFAKRRAAPVYVGELAPLLREHDYTANKTGLKHAEALIRRKTGWGGEVAENAVDLTVALCLLQNNYGLHAFEKRRTGALTALCVAAPDPVAECLVEQHFTPHYAPAQRRAMLRALAAAAHELAGLPDPCADPAEEAEALADAAASRAREAGDRRLAQHEPTLEAKHRLAQHVVGRTPRGAAPVPFAPPGAVRPRVAYVTVAAGCFIEPLLQHFAAFLQEARQRVRGVGVPRLRSAGGDAPLAPGAMAAVLHTLAVLCSAGRNAPRMHSQVVPGVLELVDVVALVGVPLMQQTAPLWGGVERGGHADTEVLGAAASLALVALDIAWERDRGAALLREHPALVVRVQEMAHALFEQEEQRHAAERDAAPAHEALSSPSARARRSAAALLVRLGELQEQMRQALLPLGGRLA